MFEGYDPILNACELIDTHFTIIVNFILDHTEEKESEEMFIN